jgi:hypothetical protein
MAKNAHDMLGPWWGRGQDADAVTVFDGIAAQNPKTTYAEGCAILDKDPPDPPNDECGSTAGFDEAVEVAKAAEQVVLALGEPGARAVRPSPAPTSTCRAISRSSSTASMRPASRSWWCCSTAGRSR